MKRKMKKQIDKFIKNTTLFDRLEKQEEEIMGRNSKQSDFFTVWPKKVTKFVDRVIASKQI